MAKTNNIRIPVSKHAYKAGVLPYPTRYWHASPCGRHFRQLISVVDLSNQQHPNYCMLQDPLTASSEKNLMSPAFVQMS